MLQYAINDPVSMAVSPHDLCPLFLSLRCGKKLDRDSEETEMKRRRMKASISSPSPLPQTVEEMMHRRGMANGDVSNSNGFASGYVDGVEQYGLAGPTFLGESEFHRRCI